MNLRMKPGIAGAVAREINRLDAGHTTYEGLAWKAAWIDAGANIEQICRSVWRDEADFACAVRFGRINNPNMEWPAQ